MTKYKIGDILFVHRYEPAIIGKVINIEENTALPNYSFYVIQYETISHITYEAINFIDENSILSPELLTLMYIL